MSWLRLDDGFAMHPKVMRLARAERWTWIELLCFCARYDTGGEVPISVGEALPKVTGQFLRKCAEIGLVDTIDGVIHIHDWKVYNPRDSTNATRQQRYRAAHSNGDRNETRNGKTVTDNALLVTPRARASRPVPNTTTNQPTSTEDQAGSVFEIDVNNILSQVDAA